MAVPTLDTCVWLRLLGGDVVGGGVWAVMVVRCSVWWSINTIRKKFSSDDFKFRDDIISKETSGGGAKEDSSK